MVSILIGKLNGEIKYYAVFANRDLAEEQKEEFVLWDKLNKASGWEYLILTEKIRDKIMKNP